MTVRWIPNAVSLLRIALVVPVLLLILNGKYSAALLLFMIAGFSDGLDGYLAQRLDCQTRLGALLDPVADKLLVAGVFVTLTIIGLIPVWLTTIVILRDAVIFGGAVLYHYLIRPVEGEPSRISKLNTALELLFLLFVLSKAAYAWPEQISLTVLGAAMYVTVIISGVDYVLRWSDRAMKGA